MNMNQQQQLSDWPAGIVTHGRAACDVIRPAGTTDGFPTVQQSKRLVSRPHHTRQFFLSVFNCSGRSKSETVRVWGALDRRVTIDEVADHLQISHGSAYEIIHNRLGFHKVCARWGPKQLTVFLGFRTLSIVRIFPK
jgi:hypothetical protein